MLSPASFQKRWTCHDLFLRKAHDLAVSATKPGGEHACRSQLPSGVSVTGPPKKSSSAPDLALHASQGDRTCHDVLFGQLHGPEVLPG